MWALFWYLQGGPDVSRKGLTLRPMYDAEQLGRFADALKRLRGVLARDDDRGIEHSQVTRLHTWTVQISGKAQTEAIQAGWSDRVRTRTKHTDLFTAYERIEEEKREGAAFAPWTGVNNCTKPAAQSAATAVPKQIDGPLDPDGRCVADGHPPSMALRCPLTAIRATH